jgi:regulator of sirC expression with transglutaminase-like and TPR domain
LDTYARALRSQIDFSSSAESILATINQYLFEHLGFSGNEENYYDPDNSYLNRVIDRRTGNPISLSLIYLLITRRLRLPVVGIGMPGHFLCRYQSATKDEIYINAFNRGKLLTRADCIKFLHKNGYGFQDDFLGPVSPRRIFLRICTNLHRIYMDEERDVRRSRLERYIAVLGK